MRSFVPIAMQCQERNQPVPLGSTAKSVRELGFEVPDGIPDGAILRRQGPDETLPGAQTGYVWDHSMATRLDHEFLQRLFEGTRP